MQCSTEGDLDEPEEHEKWSAEKRRTDWEDLYEPCVQHWTACHTEKSARSLLERNASQAQGCQHATSHSFLIQDFFPPSLCKLGTRRLRDHLLQDEITKTAYHRSCWAHQTTVTLTYTAVMQLVLIASPILTYQGT